MGPTCIGSKKKKIQQSGMKVVMHPNASIQPPFSGWESLDGCNAIGAESTPTVDLPSTVVKSGRPSIVTTVVEGPRLAPKLAVLQPRHLLQLSPQVLEVQVLVMVHIDCHP